MEKILKIHISKVITITLLTAFFITGCDNDNSKNTVAQTKQNKVGMSDPNSIKINAFISCKQPFNPTKRLRELIKAGIIPANQSFVSDGIPHFIPNKNISFYGFPILFIGTYVLGEKNEFYSRGPGTAPSTQVFLILASTKTAAKTQIPKQFLKALYIFEQTNFWRNLKVVGLEHYRPELAGSKVISLKCTKDNASENDNS